MRFFTLQEANAFVPALSAAFGDISRLRLQIVRLAIELSELGERPGVNAPAEAEMPEPVRERRLQIDDAVRKIRNVIGELEAHGVIVKEIDGVVDFRALRARRPVFLSWHLGESQVQSWHEMWTDATQPVDRQFPKALLN
jgi:hypothetical protein